MTIRHSPVGHLSNAGGADARLAVAEAHAYWKGMEELLRSNDAVTLSFVEALMKEAGIVAFIADQHMSILEGSIGAIPRRIMVDGDRIDQARRIVRDAGLGHELKDTA